MSKHAFIIIIIVVAAVALAGGYLFGLNSSNVSIITSDAAPIASDVVEPSVSVSPDPEMSGDETNLFDESADAEYSNPLEAVQPNPFN